MIIFISISFIDILLCLIIRENIFSDLFVIIEGHLRFYVTVLIVLDCGVSEVHYFRADIHGAEISDDWDGSHKNILMNYRYIISEFKIIEGLLSYAAATGGSDWLDGSEYLTLKLDLEIVWLSTIQL